MKEEKTMKALILEGPSKIVVKEVPIPKPKDGQVLIKVMAAPINPSDLIFMQKAEYAGGKTVPCTPGFEGSGIVVQNGGGIIGWGLVNKKVAFSPIVQSGTYAQYAIASSSQCLPVDEKMSFQHASMSFVNPLTAVAMLDILKNKNAKGVILTASASSLGRMLNRFLPQEGIQIINIVRRDEQMEVLRKQGATIVLNSSDQNFTQRLTEMATKIKATICFDAIGGETSGKILKCMPKYSQVHVYGVLSGQNVNNVDVVDILYNHKTITGLFLPNWMEAKGTMKMLPTMMKLRKWLLRQLRSEISREFSINNCPQAIKFYMQNMTKGKVVVKPWAEPIVQNKNEKIQSIKEKINEKIQKPVQKKQANEEMLQEVKVQTVQVDNTEKTEAHQEKVEIQQPLIDKKANE